MKKPHLGEVKKSHAIFSIRDDLKSDREPAHPGKEAGTKQETADLRTKVEKGNMKKNIEKGSFPLGTAS